MIPDLVESLNSKQTYLMLVHGQNRKREEKADMGKEDGRGRSRRRRISRARKFLNHEGKKLCASALCVSMLFGSVMNTTIAASKETDDDGYEFELSRASLYQALQDAVLNGSTVDEELEFYGSAAEEYSELLAPGGSLYELKPELKDNDGSLKLRVFAKLDQEIELDSEYEAAGTEEIMFLLTNRSDEPQKAVICVDDKYTEEIEVAPGDAIAVPEDEAAQGPAGGGTAGGGASAGGGAAGWENAGAGETAGPADENGQAPDSGETPAQTQPEETTGAKEETDADTSEDASAPTEETGNAGDSQAPADETEGVSDSGQTEESGAAGEENDSTAGGENESDEGKSPAGENGSGETGNTAGKEENGADGSGNAAGGDGNSGAAESGDQTDTDSGENAGSSTENGSSSAAGSENSSAGSGSASGNDSPAGNTGADSDGGNDSSDSVSEGEKTAAASISLHRASLVAAPAKEDPMATDSELPVATDSELATDSEMEKLIDGDLYEAVRLKEDGAVLFVTTLDDLGVMDGWGPIVFGQQFEQEIDGFRVRAIARKGVLPDGAELEVEELREDDAQTADNFREAKETLDAAMTEEGSQYDGMFALDIRFIDENGDEVEPNGDVQVTIEVEEGKFPEDVALETVKVHHLKEVGTDTVEVEAVADGAGETDGTVKSADEVVDELKEAQVPEEEIPEAVSGKAEAVAAFRVDRFSYFTITWKSNLVGDRSVNIYLIDNEGNKLGGEGHNSQWDDSIDSGLLSGAVNFNELAPYVSGNYTYQYAVIAANEEEAKNISTDDQVYRLKYNYEIEIFGGKSSWQYNESVSGGSWKDLNNGDNIYLIYSKDEPGGSGGSGGDIDIKEPTPSISKKAIRNNDGTYDLSLSVTGSIGSQSSTANVDVLMVVDTSGSMGNNGRLGNLKTAMKTLVNTMEEKEGVDARYSIVSFATNGEEKIGWTVMPSNYRNIDLTEIGRTINRLNADGGTNYMAGLRLAKNLLQESYDNQERDAFTVVVFLSDGEPTYYYTSHNSTSVTGPGNDELGTDSLGWRLTAETADDIVCNRFYSVGIGSSMKKYLNTNNLNSGLVDAVNATDDKAYVESDDDGSNLADLFKDIAGSATTLHINNVTITDQLNTQYAEFVPDDNGNVQLDVKVTNEWGRDASEEIQTGGINAVYDQRSAELKLNFNPEYQLKDHYTYTVTMKIQPTQEAKNYYTQYGRYPDTPTENVDTGTHSGEEGFFSNEWAKLTYRNTNDEPGDPMRESEYPKPVIQLTVGDLTIHKIVEGLDGDSQALAELKKELSFVITDSEGELVATIPYEKFVSDTCTIENLMPGTYTVEEVGYENIDGYKFKTSASETKKKVSVVVGQNNQIEFTNKYAKDLIIPTGVFNDKLPYLLMSSVAILCTAGVLFNNSIKRRRENEE